MPDILFPAGRMVGGNLDKLNQAKKNGQLLFKDGKPVMECNIGYAIAKGAETDWKQTSWGKQIYEIGAAAHPDMVSSPAFAWKVVDGDSAIPNKNGKKPCEQAGHPGHWVLWFKQGWLPKRVNADGSVELPEGSIVSGYYIQMYASVAGNKPPQGGTPGVYLNPIAVALVGEGERLASDVDTTSVGFGAAPLPAGAKPVTAAAPQFAASAPTPAASVAPPPPNTAILTVPAAAPVHQMTAKAAGATYEAFIAQNWTDEMLRKEGYML